MCWYETDQNIHDESTEMWKANLFDSSIYWIRFFGSFFKEFSIEGEFFKFSLCLYLFTKCMSAICQVLRITKFKTQKE